MSSKKYHLLILPFLGILFLLTLFLYQYTQNEDSRFEAYTDSLFRQEVSSNAISLHYTLKDPSAYRIHTLPTTLGQISINTNEIGAAAENALATLHTYNKNQLSPDNQLTYELLEYTFILARNSAPYALYEEPLSPLTGTQAQLPVLLSEYQFYSTKDVDTYLILLKSLPAYFQGIMDFETAKSKQGLFMSKARANAVAKECESFVNMKDENYLHKTFKSRLKSLNLSKKQYQNYISQNTSIINEYVYPAYISLKEHLLSLKDTGINENGLCYFSDGEEYYKLLVNEVTGSSRSILELQALIQKQITEDLLSMQNTLENMPDLEFTDNTNLLADSNPNAILATLKNSLADNFPSPPNVSTSIKYVEECMEDYLSPAFYLIPAIDNYKENIIYINPKHMTDDIALFTTMAHEGYPGHLYQSTYFSNTKPTPIRHLLACGGYVEGWATYCEMMSYYLAPVSKPEATIMQKNASVMLGLYALADIGIHHEGWTLTDTIKFFNNYGIYDTDAIGEIFNLILGDPANYLKYYIGYVEFLELKKDAMKTWGNTFTQKRFHKEILDAGPVPFKLLRKGLGFPQT